MVLLALGSLAQSGSATDAQKEYEQLYARIAQLHSVTGVFVEEQGQKKADRTYFKLMRPNYFRASNALAVFAGDGKQNWFYDKASKQYVSAPAKPDRTAVRSLAGFEQFDQPDSPLFQFSGVHDANFRGTKCRGLDIVFEQQPKMHLTLYLNKTTGLPAGYAERLDDKPGQKTVGYYLDLKLDPPLKPEDFAWSPPKGSTQYTPPPQKG
jgi:outer membrane lipoprotein-sorting protein